MELDEAICIAYGELANKVVGDEEQDEEAREAQAERLIELWESLGIPGETCGHILAHMATLLGAIGPMETLLGFTVGMMVEKAVRGEAILPDGPPIMAEGYLTDDQLNEWLASPSPGTGDNPE